MTGSSLALLGGQPAVTRLGPHFSWPPIGHAATQAVLDQLGAGISIYDRSGVIARLEDALRTFHGVRHAVLTSSGTAALHSMYAACGLGPGDEVIVPAYTFFATVTPLLHLGAVPVLVDCDDTGNLDPADIAHRVTAKTKAIVVTHMWGIPANAEALIKVAHEHGLILLEDGSHAHGASIDGQRVGTFGSASAFSMNGPKPLSAGEGGFLLTDDDEIYYRALLHGQYNKRCRNEIPADHPLHRYGVTGTGLKLRIHPLAAALALQQLADLDHRLQQRSMIADYLCERLRELPGITTPDLPTGVTASWYGLLLRYHPEPLDGLPLRRVFEALQAEGCREVDRPGSTCPLNQLPLFQDPGPLLPAYAGAFAYFPGDFPVAERFHDSILKLPVWHDDSDLPLAQEYVNAFTKILTNHRDLG